MIIDTHAHLTTKEFEEDLASVVKRAEDSGVVRIINIGHDEHSSEQTVKLSNEYENLYATVGLHPEECLSEDIKIDSLVEKLKSLVASPKVVAIGEIGIDNKYISDRIDSERVGWAKEKQLLVLEKQLNLALDTNLPAIIHCRHAENDLFDILEKFTRDGGSGVLHSYTGNSDFMDHFLELGWFVSFNGIITFKNANDVRALFMRAPLKKILLETDSPFLAPEPNRGKRCEPAFTVDTAKAGAALKNISFGNFSEITYENSCTLFKKIVGKMSRI